MSQPSIEVNHLSKKYRLGEFGARSLREEAEALWNRLRPERAGNGGNGSETTELRRPIQDDFWALRDVSFKVQPGEILGIIGRNGAGKSTLLKVLSRITKPTVGEVVMRGRVASLLEVGTGFHPELSGRENVFLNGAILGMTKAEIRRKFDEIVDFSEIGQFIDTPVKRYSSGMYVRLAFAVAAHLEPEILILDEVLAVGDSAFQKKCLSKMQNISSQDGRTILFVSHHMAAIRRLCRKCMVMAEGKSSEIMDVEAAIRIYTAEAHESAYDLDVGQRPRNWGTEGRGCRIKKVSITSKYLLAYGKPVDIEVTVQCNQLVEEAMLGFGFNTPEGGRVLTLDSDTNRRFVRLEPGQHVLRLHIDALPLHPGIYQCSVGIAGGGYFYDILDPLAAWEVTTSDVDYWSDRGFGGCRMEPAISLLA